VIASKNGQEEGEREEGRERKIERGGERGGRRGGERENLCVKERQTNRDRKESTCESERVYTNEKSGGGG